jgi:hypothetical protein
VATCGKFPVRVILRDRDHSTESVSAGEHKAARFVLPFVGARLARDALGSRNHWPPDLPWLFAGESHRLPTKQPFANKNRINLQRVTHGPE